MEAEQNFAAHFAKLRTYTMSRELSDDIFLLTKRFPKEERYALTDQIRRSSRSIGAQIAEAWGKRRYQRHFISKMSDADAEQLETQHWIDVALRCEYLTEEEAKSLIKKSISVGKMIHTMIIKAETFTLKSSRRDQY